jgi:hypothetical protein
MLAEKSIAGLTDVLIPAQLADSRTTEHDDRVRGNLDRHGRYLQAGRVESRSSPP